MLTMRAAAALLGAPPGHDALRAVARAIGFVTEPDPLAPAAHETLSLPSELREVLVCRGDGTLRALLVRVTGASSLRDVLGRLAARLSSLSPHLLWLVIAEDEQGRQRSIAGWSAARTPPRVAALTTERLHVTDSDAETLCALAAAAAGSDLLTHARWLEVLGRDALSRRFYRTLERTVGTLADALHAPGDPVIPTEERRTIALLVTSRLLFLAFLEAKGWMNGDRDYLVGTFTRFVARNGGFHSRVLEPLFFGTLNTRVRDRAPAARALGAIPYLNGGLFTRTPLERRWRRARLTDEALGVLVDELLTGYRLTAREDRSTWSDAAIDPEMLGKAFESLMAPTERRTTGAYYTPQAMVERTITEALVAHLDGAGVGRDVIARLEAGEAIGASDGAAAARALRSLRVLDPACGSGAFLVHLLERLSGHLRLCGEPHDVSTIRRAVVSRSIFGVDSNPTAVWLCELRLWLSTVIECQIEDGQRIPTLPNLDHNIHVGDSLAGTAFHDDMRWPAGRGALQRLRARYTRAAGARKRTLGRELERTLRAGAQASLLRTRELLGHERRDLLMAMRQHDLFGERRSSARDANRLGELKVRLRDVRRAIQALADGATTAFSYPLHFADVAADGGFDVVVGNPPWVRLHNIPRQSRERLRADFTVFRNAAWESGALAAGAGRGFAAQVDLAALFSERSVALLRPGGVLALLLPAKLWKSLAGGGVRRLLSDAAPPLLLEDWSDSAAAFDAAVYPSLLVARARSGERGDVRAGGSHDTLACAVHHRGRPLGWTLPRSVLALDSTPGSPWLLVPPEVRAAFECVRAAGVPLADSAFGRPLLGVKCGLNDAFVVPADDSFADASLRPLVRGESITPWRVSVHERILWTHGEDGTALPALSAAQSRRLAPFRRALLARSDLRTGNRWWTLFRVESADPSTPRVVWGDVGRVPRAAFVDAGERLVALNSCYVARCRDRVDALALTTLLNSPLAAAWLGVLAEPARGGYRRFLGWTMACLPMPEDWSRARTILAPLGELAIGGSVPAANALLEAAARAYRIRRRDVAPLVAWAER